MPPQSRIVTLDVGELALPEGFVHRRVGMTDSLMGEVGRADGSLVVSYDIGPMAGVHMHPRKRTECVRFRERTVGGRKVYTGLVEEQGKRELIVTVMTDEGSAPLALPANFRAAVRSRRDIADVQKIAAGYRPRGRR